jgi:ribosomal protein S18 acetylase RimI-like enzyme
MPTIELCEETAEDEAFLRQLYASVRAGEMALVPWPDDRKKVFLDMQFDLQRRHYRTHYPNAEFSVILVEGNLAGRWYLDRGNQGFLLIDIALMPDRQDQGVGTRLLKALLAEAEARAKPVRLHVESFNDRAMNLYRRLGFSPVEPCGIHWLMEWKPV